MVSDYLIKAYMKADQFFLDRANEAVKAWNWTTGRTRADLVDVVNVAGNVLTYSGDHSWGPFGVIDILALHTGFQDMDKKEEKAIEKNALDYDVETTKKGLKLFSGVYSTIGLSLFPVESKTTDTQLMGSGIVLMGLSFYIMRADYQKPRKNVLARAAKKIKKGLEKIAEKGWNPFPQPVPETVNTGGYR